MTNQQQPTGKNYSLAPLIGAGIIMDLIWAFMVSTFIGSILSSGLSLAQCGGTIIGSVGTAGVVSGSIFAFIVAFIQGAIFLVVATVIGVFLINTFAGSSTDNAALWRFCKWVLILDTIWAFAAALFLKSAMGLGFGLASSFAGCLESIDLGFFGSLSFAAITFVVAFIQGLVFAIVLSVIAVALYSLFGKPARKS